jgi:heptosyltransferase I
MKILIIRLSAIGDIIHVLPSYFLLREYFPIDNISWIVDEKAYQILKNIPNITNIYLLKKDFKNYIHKEWDFILDYHNLFKTIFIRSFLIGKIFTLPYNLARNNENKLGSFICKNNITEFNSNNIV